MSDHKLWPKIKEQGIESQNAEYWGGTKTGAKAARHFCGWTTKIYNSREQHLQERCKTCRHDIEITEINTYISQLEIVKSAVLPHLTANNDARCQKVRKTSRKSTICCLLQQKNYYVWLVCLLYRIFGYKKRPRICKKQKITYHLRA